MNVKVHVHDRVQVAILNDRDYAFRCAQALNGMTGVVERYDANGDLAMVRFDKPAPTWWTHQTPVTGFWFPVHDLQVIRTPYKCHCCTTRFESAKPQDPNRDLGYGTCTVCRATAYVPNPAKCAVCHGVSPTGSMCTACSCWSPSERYA